MLINNNFIGLRKNHKLKGEVGFSLPEILIVLLTISILAVIALPQSRRTVQLYRLDTGVSAIGGKLMEARMNAIKRNKTCWLRLDKSTKTVVIRSTNSANEIIDVNFTETLPTGIDLNSTQSVEISFDSMGRLTLGAQTIVIKEVNYNTKKDITISPAGKITVSQMY